MAIKTWDEAGDTSLLVMAGSHRFDRNLRES